MAEGVPARAAVSRHTLVTVGVAGLRKSVRTGESSRRYRHCAIHDRLCEPGD